MAIEEGAEEGAIALEDVFIGVGIALAILFIVLSFVLHNSYHSVRVWNLTEYALDWVIHFDTSQAQDQVELVAGPVTYDSNNNITKYARQQPVSYSQAVPGSVKTWSCHYADLNINSSHESSGIDNCVLQYSLTDQSGKVPYKVTIYFDIPFSGQNSTNVSLDSRISDLQAYYDQNSGNNTNTQATTTSSDGNITLTTTYDFLSGKHGVPNTPPGSSSNQQFFYQSVITIVQNNMSQNTLAKLEAGPHSLPKLVAARTGGIGLRLKGLHPRLRKQITQTVKRNLTAAKK